MLAHQIEFSPYTHEQEIVLRKSCGVARFTYNWALAEWTRQYKQGEKPSANQLKKQFNKIKGQQFPWIYEVTKCAAEHAFVNLSSAFTRFFKKQARYPQFKKKGEDDAFYVSNDKFKLEGTRLRIQKLGWVKLTEEVRFPGKIMSLTVRRRADRWFVAFNIELDAEYRDTLQLENQEFVGRAHSLRSTPNNMVGVDLGIKRLVTLSDGTQIEGPRPLRKYIARLKRMSRKLSNKTKGSANRKKAKERLSKLHWKISNIRKDALHNITTMLVKTYGVICLEDLNVSGMVKNHTLAQAISDMGFAEFKRQLEYKSLLRGAKVLYVGRFFPSSKTCSQCKTIKQNLTLSDREYTCEHCGLHIDRDWNAAINILNQCTVGYTGS